MILCSESGVGKVFLTGPDSNNFRLVCHMISAATTQFYCCTVDPATDIEHLYAWGGCVPIKLSLQNRCLTQGCSLPIPILDTCKKHISALLHLILMKSLCGG